MFAFSVLKNKGLGFRESVGILLIYIPDVEHAIGYGKVKIIICLHKSKCKVWLEIKIKTCSVREISH